MLIIIGNDIRNCMVDRHRRATSSAPSRSHLLPTRVNRVCIIFVGVTELSFSISMEHVEENNVEKIFSV